MTWVKVLDRRLLSAVALLLIGGCAAPPAPPPPTPAAPSLGLSCTMSATDSGYAGSCSVPCSVNALAVNFNGIEPARRCDGPPRSVAATLARTAVPGRWLGTMQGVQPEDPTRLELVPGKAGSGGSANTSVARTPFGWFAVQQMQATPASLNLVLDASRQVRPTSDDLAIIDRTIALLPNAEGWNKQDTRQCPAGQPRLSLFCALMQATTEVSGGVHYRQPAMQAVREELNRVDPARIKTHRIMDFNNHPATTLDEVHTLLRKARERVGTEVR